MAVLGGRLPVSWRFLGGFLAVCALPLSYGLVNATPPLPPPHPAPHPPRVARPLIQSFTQPPPPPGHPTPPPPPPHTPTHRCFRNPLVRSARSLLFPPCCLCGGWHLVVQSCWLPLLVPSVRPFPLDWPSLFPLRSRLIERCALGAHSASQRQKYELYRVMCQFLPPPLPHRLHPPPLPDPCIALQIN